MKKIVRETFLSTLPKKIVCKECVDCNILVLAETEVYEKDIKKGIIKNVFMEMRIKLTRFQVSVKLLP
jgi:hypothetical protein